MRLVAPDYKIEILVTLQSCSQNILLSPAFPVALSLPHHLLFRRTRWIVIC